MDGVDAHMGGIAGRSDGTIENCYATIDITLDCENAIYQQGNNFIEVAGIGSGGTITNCYYSGALTAHAANCLNSSYPWKVGGISIGGTITNCLVLSRDISLVIDNGPV